MPGSSIIFPSVGTQILSALLHFLGVSVLAHCISRRVARETLSIDGLRQIPWTRLCVLLVFLDSWLFLFSSGILIFGAGLELNAEICAAGIYICVVFYATSKLLLYFFLIERVHVVWAPAASRGRFKSPIYVVCFVTVTLYSGVMGLMIAGKIHGLREHDSVCVIGLETYSSVPLLSYDLYINIFLTALFVSPLLKSSRSNPRVRRLARRALVAASAGLTTSTTNIAVLTAVHGKQLGWVCLGSCGLDVVLNALALFWVTSTPSSHVQEHETVITTDNKRQVQFSVASGQQSQQLRSILRVPQPIAVDTNVAGPHPITRQYYQTRIVSPTSTSLSITQVGTYMSKQSKSQTESSSHPFARPKYNPSVAEPEITITADAPPIKVKPPSALTSLVDLFRSHPVQEEAEVEITVTTEVDIQSIHDGTSERGSEVGSDDDSFDRQSRAHSV